MNLDKRHFKENETNEKTNQFFEWHYDCVHVIAIRSLNTKSMT